MGRDNKRDRSKLEIGDKVSPPGKMAKYSINDVMEKLLQLEARMIKLEKLLEEVEELREEVGELKKFKEGYQRFEIEQKKKCLLIKGMRSSSSLSYETRKETKSCLAGLFEYIGHYPRVDDYQRLGTLKPGDSQSTLIRVQFGTIDDKIALFQRFKDIGKDFELSKISLINDYPSFQLPEVKRLSEIAYDLRTKKPGTKTRIVPKGLTVNLQTLQNGKWKTVSPDENPNQIANSNGNQSENGIEM
jgi:hypothetical protein